jgi:hypothetical protein
MSPNNTMISDPELHAYVDDALPEERRAVVDWQRRIWMPERSGPATVRRAARSRQINEGSQNEAMGCSKRRASATRRGRVVICIRQGG